MPECPPLFETQSETQEVLFYHNLIIYYYLTHDSWDEMHEIDASLIFKNSLF